MPVDPMPVLAMPDLEIENVSSDDEDDPGAIIARTTPDNPAQRRKITLSCDYVAHHALVLTRSNTKIDVYNGAGARITFDGTDNLFRATNEERSLEVHLWVEGTELSDTLADSVLSLAYDSEPFASAARDSVRFTVVEVDLDVDSDNSNGLEPPDRSSDEDDVENIADDPDHPGKIVQVNDDDADGDGIPDYADGFDRDGEPDTDDDETPGEAFVPIVLELPPVLWDIQDFSADATVTFIYNASDPSGVTYDEETGVYTLPTTGDPPVPFRLRLWTVDGSTPRSKLSITADPQGHFVPSGVSIPIADLGLGVDPGSVMLYLEVVDFPDSVAQGRIKVDLHHASCGHAGSIVTDTVRVSAVRLEYLTSDGSPLDYGKGIMSINARTLTRACVPGGLAGTVVPSAIPELEGHRYKVWIGMQGPLSNTQQDIVKLGVHDTFHSTNTEINAAETGPDTGVFAALAPPGIVPFPETTFTLLNVDQDGSYAGAIDFVLQDVAAGVQSSGTAYRISDDPEWDYSTPWVDVTLHLEETTGAPRTITVESLAVDGHMLPVGTLAEDEATPGRFASTTPSIVLTITASTDHGPAAPDSLAISVLHGSLAGRLVTANVVEDAHSSNRFSSPHLGGLVGADGDRVPTLEDIVSQHGYRVRVSDPNATSDTYTVALLAKLDTGQYKVIGVLEAMRVSPGVYESAVNLNVAQLDDLPAEVAESLHQHNLLHGSGSPLKIVVAGVVVTTVAYEVVAEVGGLVDDAANWCWRSGLIFMGDGPNSGQKYCYVNDTGAIWCGLGSRSSSSWKAEVSAIEEQDYSLDINMYAESPELLEWLWDMDRDDILIYWGHSATARDLIVPPGGTHKIMQSCDGLCGYRSGLLWQFDTRGVPELASYMTYEGKGHAPGIVVIGGCASFLDPLKSTFMAKGTKLYVGFSQSTNAAKASTCMSLFLTSFFKEGKSVNQALDDANSPQVFTNFNSRVTAAERTFMWAVTSEGEVYNYDNTPTADPHERGRKGIPRNLQYFLTLMKTE